MVALIVLNWVLEALYVECEFIQVFFVGDDIDVSSENETFSSDTFRRELIWRKLDCVDNFSKGCPEEVASGVGCLSRNDRWNFKKSGVDSPVSPVEHAWEGLETFTFCFETGLPLGFA